MYIAQTLKYTNFSCLTSISIDKEWNIFTFFRKRHELQAYGCFDVSSRNGAYYCCWRSTGWEVRIVLTFDALGNTAVSCYVELSCSRKKYCKSVVHYSRLCWIYLVKLSFKAKYLNQKYVILFFIGRWCIFPITRLMRKSKLIKSFYSNGWS